MKKLLVTFDYTISYKREGTMSFYNGRIHTHRNFKDGIDEQEAFYLVKIDFLQKIVETIWKPLNSLSITNVNIKEERLHENTH